MPDYAHHFVDFRRFHFFTMNETPSTDLMGF